MAPDPGMEVEISDIRINLDGIFAMFLGLPVLALTCGIIGFLLIFPPRRFLKIVAIILAAPALLIGLALVTDALAAGRGPGGVDTFYIVFIVAYFTLLGLLPCLLVIQVRRKAPENPAMR